MDVWLQCGGRVLAAASAAISRDSGNGKSDERIGCAWWPGDFHCHGNEHNGHRRQLERQRRAGWERNARNDYVRRCVHRTRGPAIARDDANHGHQPC